MKLAESTPGVCLDAGDPAQFLVGECFAVCRPFGVRAHADADADEDADDAGVQYHVHFEGTGTDDPYESVLTGAELRRGHARWRARYGLDGVGSSRVDTMHVMHLHNMEFDMDVIS